MTKAEKLEHLEQAAKLLEATGADFLLLPENVPEAVAQLYNAMRRLGAVVHELVAEQADD